MKCDFMGLRSLATGSLFLGLALISGCGSGDSKANYNDRSYNGSDPKLRALATEVQSIRDTSPVATVRGGDNFNVDIRSDGSNVSDSMGFTYLKRSGGGSFPAVIIAHGGSGVHDLRDDIVFLVNALVEAGYLVVLPSYRLAQAESGFGLDILLEYDKQAYRYPHQAQDIACMIRYVKADPKGELNVQLSDAGEPLIAVVGHSFGAQASSMAVLSTGTEILDSTDGADPNYLAGDIGPGCNFPDNQKNPYDYTAKVSAFVSISGSYDTLQMAADQDNWLVRELAIESIRKATNPKLPMDSRANTLAGIESIIHRAAVGSFYYWINDPASVPDYVADNSKKRQNLMMGLFDNKDDNTLAAADFVNGRSGSKNIRFPEFSAIDNFQADVSQLPPMLLIHGVTDKLSPWATAQPTFETILNNVNMKATMLVYAEGVVEHSISSWQRNRVQDPIIQFLDLELKNGNGGEPYDVENCTNVEDEQYNLVTSADKVAALGTLDDCTYASVQ